MAQHKIIRTATIASGAAVSNSIDIRNGLPVALHLTSAWTTASLFFQTSSYEGQDSGSATFDVFRLYSAAVLISAGVFTGAGGIFVQLNREWFRGANWLKINSGIPTSATDQTGERTIEVMIEERPH